jgi:hypothetical protein
MNKNRRGTTIFLTLITLGAILAPCVNAGWVRAGLENKSVSALVTAVLPGSDTLLIAGTKNDGVWMRRGNAGTFKLLANFGQSQPPSFLSEINKLYINDSTYLLFAAGDSGLFIYPLGVSMIEPNWTKVSALPQGSVTSVIGVGKTIFCCTPAEVYGSFDFGVSWAACSSRKSMPALTDSRSFTSLAFYYGINAGSKFSGSLKPLPGGIIYSGNNGKTWVDPAMFSERIPIVEVFDLANYHPQYDAEQRMLAASPEGLFYFLGGFDTGYWHSFTPQLTAAPPKSICISYHSRSLVADYWIATDSGVFRLPNQSSDWVKIFDTPAHCIVDNGSTDPTKWFAGTDDGVWCYTQGTGIAGRVVDRKGSPRQAVTACFTLNGKAVSASVMARMHGVILIRENGNYRLSRRSACGP